MVSNSDLDHSSPLHLDTTRVYDPVSRPENAHAANDGGANAEEQSEILSSITEFVGIDSMQNRVKLGQQHRDRRKSILEEQLVRVNTKIAQTDGNSPEMEILEKREKILKEKLGEIKREEEVASSLGVLEAFVPDAIQKMDDKKKDVDDEEENSFFGKLVSTVSIGISSVSESVDSLAAGLSTFIQPMQGCVRHRWSNMIIGFENGKAASNSRLMLVKGCKYDDRKNYVFTRENGYLRHMGSQLGVMAKGGEADGKLAILCLADAASSQEIILENLHLVHRASSMILQPIGGDGWNGSFFMLHPQGRGSELFQFDVLPADAPDFEFDPAYGVEAMHLEQEEANNNNNNNKLISSSSSEHKNVHDGRKNNNTNNNNQHPHEDSELVAEIAEIQRKKEEEEKEEEEKKKKKKLLDEIQTPSDDDLNNSNNQHLATSDTNKPTEEVDIPPLPSLGRGRDLRSFSIAEDDGEVEEVDISNRRFRGSRERSSTRGANDRRRRSSLAVNMEQTRNRIDSTDFKNAGMGAGLEMWGLESNNTMQKITGDNKVGVFNDGNSYVLLHTVEDMYALPSKLSFVVYTLDGSKTSQNEASVAKLKAAELCDILSGLSKCTFHAEAQGNESPEFAALFPNGITYVAGGGISRRSTETLDYKPLLFRISRTKSKNRSRLRQVPLCAASFSSNGVFVLDLGNILIQMNGKESSPAERHGSASLCDIIKMQRLCSYCQLDQSSQAHENTTEWNQFWETLNSNHQSVDDVFMDQCDDDDVNVEPVLYKMNGLDKFERLQVDHIERKLLDPSSIFLLDASCQMFIWTGSSTTTLQRDKARIAGNIQCDEIRVNSSKYLISITDKREHPLFILAFAGLAH